MIIKKDNLLGFSNNADRKNDAMVGTKGGGGGGGFKFRRRFRWRRRRK